MNRRALLTTGATVATLSLTGCAGGGGGGGESTPPPIDSSAEQLVFSLADFDEAGWSKVNEEIGDNRARREFVSQQGDVTQIYTTVWYYEKASKATDKYDELRETATDTQSTEPRDIGTEAFAYVPGTATVVFRDVNVVAKVEHYGTASGSLEIATEYATRLRNKWRA